MRFLFRTKDKDDSTTGKSSEGPSFSGLGLFSPIVEPQYTEPIQECRKLQELEEVLIRSKKLESLDDVPQIVSAVREGQIVLLDITKLNSGRDQGRLELKRIIERIRGETRCYRADIALVNDECVIVTPSFVRMGP